MFQPRKPKSPIAPSGVFHASTRKCSGSKDISVKPSVAAGRAERPFQSLDLPLGHDVGSARLANDHRESRKNTKPLGSMIGRGIRTSPLVAEIAIRSIKVVSVHRKCRRRQVELGRNLHGTFSFKSRSVYPSPLQCLVNHVVVEVPIKSAGTSCCLERCLTVAVAWGETRASSGRQRIGERALDGVVQAHRHRISIRGNLSGRWPARYRC